MSDRFPGTSFGVRLSGVFAALMASAVSSSAHATPGGCDSIASIPIRWNIDYGTDIQDLFATRCSNCHVDHGGAPFADLDLDPKWSYENLVDTPSTSGTGGIRVIPGNPMASVLYQKINCDDPDSGNRMPNGRPPLPLVEQALIYDWIMLGAPRTATDFIFATGFEPRP